MNGGKHELNLPNVSANFTCNCLAEISQAQARVKDQRDGERN